MNPVPLYQAGTLRRIEADHADLPLMQRAGLAAAHWVSELAGGGNRQILILAGPGNNGGDAFTAARILQSRFFSVCVVFAGATEKLPRDAAAAYRQFLADGGVTHTDIPQNQSWGLIIDGLFGIGLTRAPAGRYADWIGQINMLAERDACPVLALDCPSGLDADTGCAFQPCIRASHTVTFIFAKPGLYTGDGPDHCGQIRVASLDLTTMLPADGHCIDTGAFSLRLQPRQRNTHKGSFGSVGILGGAPSMFGAALLAGRAALKIGAGRVYVGAIDADAPRVDPAQPELMLRSAEALFAADLQALACGPGLGQSADAWQALELALDCRLPLVLDADALNLVATHASLAEKLQERAEPTLLTPHPAEAARLLQCTVREVQANRIATALALTQRYRSHVALKGCGTVIALASGQWWINTSGNPGMASAGMGDVLTGLLAGLLAQGWPAEQALLASVHLHGLAGDHLAANSCGPVGMTAGELIDASRSVFNRWLTAN